jgi:hypothetical protein
VLCGDGLGNGGPELAAPFGLVGSLFAEDRYRYLMVKHREAHDRCREPRDGIATMGPGATADAPPRAVMASPSSPARRTKMAKADVKRSVDSARRRRAFKRSLDAR